MLKTYHLACGCQVFTQPNSELANVQRCRKHALTGELYESLKYIVEELDTAKIMPKDSIFMKEPVSIIKRYEGGK